MSSLSRAEVEQYWERGFVNRVPGLEPSEAQRFASELRGIVTSEERRRTTPGLSWVPWPRWRDRNFHPARHTEHPLRAWAHQIARHPAIARAAESILGPDLFVRNIDIVTRLPLLWWGPSWHRDTVAPFETAGRQLTLWLGLTEAQRHNGCVWYVPGSHRLRTAELSARDRRRSLDPSLRSGLSNVDFSLAVPNEMHAGQLALHHMRTVHGTGLNRKPYTRIAIVLRMFAADADPHVVGSSEGMLVHGANRSQRFQCLESVPIGWSM